MNTSSLEALKAVSVDATASNTGTINGAIRQLELMINRAVQWLICCLHMVERVFMNLFKEIGKIFASWLYLHKTSKFVVISKSLLNRKDAHGNSSWKIILKRQNPFIGSKDMIRNVFRICNADIDDSDSPRSLSSTTTTETQYRIPTPRITKFFISFEPTNGFQSILYIFHSMFQCESFLLSKFFNILMYFEILHGLIFIPMSFLQMNVALQDQKPLEVK